MAKDKGGANFWMLGAGFWLVIAALLGIAHFFWPIISETVPFVLGLVFFGVIGGFVLAYFKRPRG